MGCIVLGLMLGWGVVQRLREDPERTSAAQQRGKPASPAAALHSVPLTLIAAEDLRLTGGGAPYELRGRIVNKTRDNTLRSVTIRLIRSDCYEGALDPSGCTKLWQDDHWIAIGVPASERASSSSASGHTAMRRARADLEGHLRADCGDG
ncbi:MAG: hypothetical protein HC872_02720 [Gammaproteobacteria bacterium]|nr:hypothetical protein [Gammaproteobacteria bacterium]